MRAVPALFLSLACLGASFDTIRPLPLAFEARSAAYVSHGGQFRLSVSSRAAVLSAAGRSIRMSIAGARPPFALEPSDRMPGRANYLLGRDVRASFDLFGSVRWRAVFPGIDVAFHENQEHLEYDFEIGPRRDPGKIQLSFEGIDDLKVDRGGNLILTASALRIVQPRPAAWQTFDGVKHNVEVAYQIDAARHVRLRTGRYDRRFPLVIDPQIIFEKSFGGSAQTTVAGMARDSQGNIYVAGTTNSTDLEVVNPFQKNLGNAALLATADGGKTFTFPALAGASVVNAIASAPSAPSTVYAATPVGVFKSSDGGSTWAVTANAGLTTPATTLTVDAGSATTLYAGTRDAGVFVSKDSGASWQSTLSGNGIAAILAHPTQPGTVFASMLVTTALYRSTDSGRTWTKLTFAPPLSGSPYALVINSKGTIIAATYQGLLFSNDLGDTWTSTAQTAAVNSQSIAVAADSTNTVYLVPSLGPARILRSTDGGQTFVAVLSSVPFSGSTRLAVDPRNPMTVYAIDVLGLFYRTTDGGQTWSKLSLPYYIAPQSIFVSQVDSRVFLGAFTQRNAFITKWSADGSHVLYSTYLGGSGDDQTSGIAVDGVGNAYVTGYTSSPNFPTTTGAFQTKLTSDEDIFVGKLSPDGSQLLYSTVLGSQGARSTGIAVDNSGNAVIVGSAGLKFPLTANAFQAAPPGDCTFQTIYAGFQTTASAFVTKLAASGSSLVYSTLLTGSCATYASGVAVDSNDNAWVAGSTIATDFPVTSDALQPRQSGGYGYYDGYLARFNPFGGRDYATYIGGSGYDVFNAIALDPSGNIYLTGESSGLQQPASAGAYQANVSAFCMTFGFGPAAFSPQGNGIVLKLDPTGKTIKGLTYFGAPGCLSPSLIAVDSTGEPWIAGNLFVANAGPQTMSPIRIGGQGFASKFSADFTQLLFSTYFDVVGGLALDSSGLPYIAGNTQTAYVAKLDPAPAPISVDSIVSVVASTTQPGPLGIAPGEVLRILGRDLAPMGGVGGVIQSGVISTNVAGVQVTFDGIAAPLLSASPQEIDVIAPFELAGKSSTTVQAQYNGAKSNAVLIPVNATSLQVLNMLNSDFTLNSASNPAKAGSVIGIYLAGAGQTNPPSQDGKINTPPLAAPALPIQLQWYDSTGQPVALAVTFAGAAPGLAAGIFQVNFVAPPQGTTVVQLTMGTAYVDFRVVVQ